MQWNKCRRFENNSKTNVGVVSAAHSIFFYRLYNLPHFSRFFKPFSGNMLKKLMIFLCQPPVQPSTPFISRIVQLFSSDNTTLLCLCSGESFYQALPDRPLPCRARTEPSSPGTRNQDRNGRSGWSGSFFAEDLERDGDGGSRWTTTSTIFKSEFTSKSRT